MLNRALPILALFFVAVVGTTARAQPRPSWDSRGWMLLGEREVNGRVDHDRIEVGRNEGKFNKLTIVVENSDLELLSFKIVFGDRTEYDPRTSHYFKEGQRTRVIDLPPGEHVIRYIDFVYKNLPGGGRARVAVWANKIGDAAPPPPPPPPAPVQWDNRGWTLLGTREVNGSVDHDRIEVGRIEGRFDKLTVVVENSDLELITFKVVFADRTEFDPRTSHYFREGQRTRVIDLPPGEHVIRYIDFVYRNLPGGGRAKVAVWANKIGEAARPAESWEARGWKLLGETVVNGHGREDDDKIRVGRYEGRFTKMNIVVLDNDLEMIDLAVKFEHGEPWHPDVKAIYNADTRNRSIDFPGDERRIKWIEFRYRNIGRGHAKVQVWAK